MSDRHPDRRLLTEFEALTGAERDDVLSHVAECESCRSVWAESDPSRLFALLGTAPLHEAALDRLSQGVDRALHEIDRASVPARSGFTWASLAASFLLAAVIGGYLISRPATELKTIQPMPFIAEEESFVGGGIEIMSPADAEVLDLTIGETQIVMIFDERLDI